MVNSRINSISSNEQVFREATPIYQIQSHNSKLLRERRKITKPQKAATARGHRNLSDGGGGYLTSVVVYKGTITAGDGEGKTYTGSTERKAIYMSTVQRLTPVATERIHLGQRERRNRYRKCKMANPKEMSKIHTRQQSV